MIKKSLCSVLLLSLFCLPSVTRASDDTGLSDNDSSRSSIAKNKSDATSSALFSLVDDDDLVDPNAPNVINPTFPDYKPIKPDDTYGSMGNGRQSFFINWVSNFKFKDIELSDGVMTQYAEPIEIENIPKKSNQKSEFIKVAPFIEISDNRKNGKGWVLNVSATPFTYGTKTLNGVSLSINDYFIKPSRVVSGGIHNSPVLNTREISFDNVNQTVMSLKANNNLGKYADIWILAFTDPTADNGGALSQLTPIKDKGLQIKVPYSNTITDKDKFVSDMTWTLMSSPT